MYYLELWQPSYLSGWIHIGNSGKWHFEELFCELFGNWTSGPGEDVVLRHFLSRAQASSLFGGTKSFGQII